MYRSMALIAILLCSLAVLPIARAQVLLAPHIVDVEQPGIVHIPLASFPGIDPALVRVLRHGQELPAHISAGMLSFVADANDSPATTTAAYWILADGTPGQRAALATTMPLRWEQDTRYVSSSVSSRGDRWFAGQVQAGTPLAVALTLPAPLAAGAPIDFDLTTLNASADHRLQLAAQGVSVGSTRWAETTPGPQRRRIYLTQALPAGAVTFTLSLVSVAPIDDALLLDAALFPTVQVPRPSIENPTLRLAATGDDTYGPTSGQAGAQVLILTHATFAPTLGPLVVMHQQRGESVAVVDVQTVYDRYSFGERDPEAIRAYIRTAVQHWTPAPRVVLLMGAGSVKLRVSPGDADPTFIPPYLVDVDPKYGEVACDTCYTRLTMSAATSQDIPDLPIGRFPVRTRSEAEQLIAKTVAALTAPAGGAWRSRILALADNDYELDGTRDRAASFPDTLNTALTTIPTYQAERFFYAPERPTVPPFYQSPEPLRKSLFFAFDAGAALMLYVGHASLWQWASTTLDAPTPFLVGLYDADARTNSQKLPILLSMACLSGNFANPTLQTIDERLVLQPGGGVAASLSPTGSGVNTSHTALLQALLPQLAARATLGVAHRVGMQAVAATGHNRELLFTYGILGHPDSVLPPVSTNLFLPFLAAP